ncbi:MAG: histidine--tRNA ligase [Deltaproteobacteria bacterium]|nr:histidine--tRNA ligase [Deltaproteobacteria bacterium]
MIPLIKGVRDIFPPDSELWGHIKKEAENLFRDFGFSEILIPIMEKTELFKRGIGEQTDIVEKEMYTFADRNGESATLRPEATASIARSYISHKMYADDPIRKFYTIGPMFRRERPQKGRYRQFYQIDAEIFGQSSPYADAQLIIMLKTLMDRLKVKDTTLHINSLGCVKCRPAFNDSFKNFLIKISDNLCRNCQTRANTNPLRTLDCKNKSCSDFTKKAPKISDFLCEECKEHFATVCEALKDTNIDFQINNRLVRGLDYYTKTAFEIQTDALGAQNAIAGGGRYDGLVKLLGGPDMPAVGFAIGFDRLAEIIALNNVSYTQKPEIFIAALGKQCIKEAFLWMSALNAVGIKTETEFSEKSLKSLMRRAGKIGALNVIIIGERELEKKEALFRDMNTKKQIEIKLDNPVKNIIEILSKKAV